MQKIKIRRVLVLGSSGVVGHGVSTDLIKNKYYVLGTSNKKKLFGGLTKAMPLEFWASQPMDLNDHNQTHQPSTVVCSTCSNSSKSC